MKQTTIQADGSLFSSVRVKEKQLIWFFFCFSLVWRHMVTGSCWGDCGQWRQRKYISISIKTTGTDRYCKLQYYIFILNLWYILLFLDGSKPGVKLRISLKELTYYDIFCFYLNFICIYLYSYFICNFDILISYLSLF